ncbi:MULTISPECIES: LysE family transporter [Methylobacterium]|jgi:threonine efflux protein|uniref:LysE family translocator n=1 Tax=Methylobacterium TaxID=407 RepID=UPI0008F2C157|nr:MULTISPECIES: LysE family transporter [Methylobacterium]MBZ6413497.1 LysE family transporter [Methylobacterium sp.]MBK3398398.1 LysE family transporter [Methylobacterium ajmalii]MBK3409018.1 LysE family transporter [Methylobacterium ajmalii]MBK3420805.1 LysE family transporter [Methylobacterium ajmalii]SFF50354.1 Threonine/homoserine/homoserine lactone efflux protein [Methylobacterium sp. yr596]
MSLSINLPLILSAAFVASASPGPATLAIADTAMQAGRRTGLALALGVVTGSLAWSIAAALGLAAVMASSAWMLEAMRYCGGAYLLYLAYRSARSAIRGSVARTPEVADLSAPRAYAKGLALHLTNPKAILFFGSLYTLGLSPRTSAAELILVIAAVGLQSAAIFTGYALLFSHGRIARAYLRLRRWFEGAFALLFAGAGLRVLTTRLPV